MQNLEALSLANEEVLPVIRVHPTAVFSILNHYSKRTDLDTRVIGTLMGSKDGNVVEIMDCYGVPVVEEQAEDNLKIKINTDYHKQMFAAHRRISKKEEVVGWYSTTAGKAPTLITNTSSVINNFYAKQCDDELPVHLVVDATLTGDSMGIRGFVAKPITLDDQTFADMFEEVSVEVVMTEAETTAIYHMMLGDEQPEAGIVKMQAWEETETTSQIPTSTESVTHTVEQLLKTIDEITQYVDNVLEDKAESMPAVGVCLAQALASLQNYNKDQISAQLQDKVQDLMMVAYLTTLLKTQLKISDKIHSIL